MGVLKLQFTQQIEERWFSELKAPLNLLRRRDKWNTLTTVLRYIITPKIINHNNSIGVVSDWYVKQENSLRPLLLTIFMDGPIKLFKGEQLEQPIEHEKNTKPQSPLYANDIVTLRDTKEELQKTGWRVHKEKERPAITNKITRLSKDKEEVYYKTEILEVYYFLEINMNNQRISDRVKENSDIAVGVKTESYTIPNQFMLQRQKKTFFFNTEICSGTKRFSQ